MDLLCQILPDIIYSQKKHGIMIAFGGSSVVFIREIPMFSVYKLHGRIISWSPNGKWLYIQGVFTLPAKKSIQKRTENGPAQLPISVNNFDADLATASGTSSPAIAGEVASPTTLSGEKICAVIYGRYVFKRPTRETVPVPEVLAIYGYTGDQEIEKKRAEGWEYVKGLEHDWHRDRALHSARDI